MVLVQHMGGGGGGATTKNLVLICEKIRLRFDKDNVYHHVIFQCSCGPMRSQNVYDVKGLPLQYGSQVKYEHWSNTDKNIFDQI